jgi:Flp pilus assembly protein TadB
MAESRSQLIEVVARLLLALFFAVVAVAGVTQLEFMIAAIAAVLAFLVPVPLVRRWRKRRAMGLDRADR